ncbi:YciI family protein [Paenibacillus kribbensis]|uniref:YciI family protein n=1 Tax=Paenibacillus kribbensis TaxID=172713 RepID=UPI00083841A3|nr:YciI family protein [Paenibacillus kribbensis]
MKYYAVFLTMLDQEKSQAHRDEHLAYLEEQRSKGRIFANGRFADGWGGMVIYKSESIDQVQEWVENDPYVIRKARRYEMHEWEMVI